MARHRSFKEKMATKTHLASGSSFYPLKASLGTQVTKGEADKKVFREDVEAMSRGMNDPVSGGQEMLVRL